MAITCPNCGCQFDATLFQFAPQQSAQHERENTVEDVDLDFLVGPVALWAQRDAVRIFHVAECALDMVLTAVPTDDLHIAPISVVRKENRFAEEGRLQTVPHLVVETIGEDWKPVFPSDLDVKQFLHVSGFQPSIHFLFRRFHCRRFSASDFPRAP